MTKNNAVSANGVSGQLIRIFGSPVTYAFRVYDENHNFVDYDLLHCDLTITINDGDAFFYTDSDHTILDHSPETLGLA